MKRVVPFASSLLSILPGVLADCADPYAPCDDTGVAAARMTLGLFALFLIVCLIWIVTILIRRRNQAMKEQ